MLQSWTGAWLEVIVEIDVLQVDISSKTFGKSMMLSFVSKYLDGILKLSCPRDHAVYRTCIRSIRNQVLRDFDMIAEYRLQCQGQKRDKLLGRSKSARSVCNSATPSVPYKLGYQYPTIYTTPSYVSLNS